MTRCDKTNKRSVKGESHMTRKNRLFAGVMLFALLPFHAQALSLAPQLTGEPFNWNDEMFGPTGFTFSRPSVSCDGSTSGNYEYRPQQFQVDTPGEYEITSIQDFDGMIFLYEREFISTEPGDLSDCIAANDDDGFIGRSSMLVDLEPGVSYVLVTSTFLEGETGDFKNYIVGPGQVTTNFGGTAWSGETTIGKGFNRPLSDCGSVSPYPVAYDTLAFRVNVSGAYGFSASQDGYDGYLHIYEGEFNPALPLQGCLAANDDGQGGIGTSDISSVNLLAGRNYVVVASGFSESDAGEYEAVIGGPGLVTTGIFGDFGYTNVASVEPGALTGLWFDPFFDGAGFNILDSPLGLIITYYGYINGEQRWLISAPFPEHVTLNRYVDLDLLIGDTGDLTSPQPPSSLDTWGSLRIQFSACDTATVQIFSLFGDFEEFELVRLAGNNSRDCSAF
jgi:hypothetical protein